jgi:hypothetical protein
MRCWNPTYKREETRFFGGRKIIFRKFEFWRIAVPAVLDNRASRLLEFRYGDEVSGRRSGPTRVKKPESRSQSPESRTRCEH